MSENESRDKQENRDGLPLGVERPVTECREEVAGDWRGYTLEALHALEE
jgi:hypothetical protein